MNRPVPTPETGRPDRERLDELLADRATVGLDPTEWDELAALLDTHPEVDPESWELTAAGIDQALCESHELAAEPLPEHLRRGIVAQGRLAVRAAHAKEREKALEEEPTSRPAVARLESTPPAPAATDVAVSGARLGWLGTAASMAAGFALALLVQTVIDRPISPERAYDALRADVPDAREVQFEFPGADGTTSLRGTVIWSDERQEGYLRFEGMPQNDPTNEQYQLWIVDPDVDPNPVDGGVFDIAGSGLRTIPIDAKLLVDGPTTFVVTKERAGGVVVSKQGDVRAVAKFTE